MRASLLVAAVAVALPGVAMAGSLRTGSGRVLENASASIEYHPGLPAQVGVYAEDEDGFTWRLQGRLSAEEIDLRTFDLESRRLGNEAGTAAIFVGQPDDHDVASAGPVHLDLRPGILHIEVDSTNGDVAATADADLEVTCFVPSDQEAIAYEFCRQFRDLEPLPGACAGGGEALLLISRTAALVEGTVSSAEERYDECAGPRRVHTLSRVVTHAGQDVGRTVEIPELGGPLPDGSILDHGNATYLARGKRYLLLLVDDSEWRWFDSPLVTGNAFRIERIHGKDVLIDASGSLILGFRPYGFAYGATVAEPNDGIGRPFAAPRIFEDIDPLWIEDAATPAVLVEQMLACSRAAGVPFEGTFHREPDPTRSWESPEGTCSPGSGCGGCAAGDVQDGGVVVALLALLAATRRRRRRR